MASGKLAEEIGEEIGKEIGVSRHVATLASPEPMRIDSCAVA
jgi:hypothetical protein